MNPLVPLFILLPLPLAAIGLVLYTDEGINPDLFYAAVKNFVILGAIAVAMSFGAMKLSERTKTSELFSFQILRSGGRDSARSSVLLTDRRGKRLRGARPRSGPRCRGPRR